MKLYLDCYPCLLRQAVEAARMATGDEALQQAAVQGAIEALRAAPPEARPVDIAPGVHAAVRRATGCNDPYRAMKQESNRLALEVYEDADALVSAAQDPLLTATKIAAAGNIADAALGRRFEFRQTVREAAERDFVVDDSEQLRAELDTAEHVLLLADNAGEIVLDRLVVERLAPRRVTVAVKSRPLINDATADDAVAAGLDGVAEIVGTGDGWPDPELERASKELARAFAEADAIIAKGQANYEALSEYHGPLYFLLTAKCDVIADDVGVAVGGLVLKRAHSQ